MESQSGSRTEKIAVVGAGNMGSALIRGLIGRVGIAPSQIVACDSEEQKREALTSELGISTTADAASAAQGAGIVIISVKPGIVPEVTSAIGPVLAAAKDAESAPPLVVSVAAGITLAELRQRLGTVPRLVRVMPSIPCMIGEGVCGIVAEKAADTAIVRELLAGLGTSYELANESMIDVFTALGASAPAFVFVMLEALTEGAVRMGLARESAAAIAAQMMRGSAELVVQSGIHPVKLKEMVASPGGTTVAGLQVLENAAVRGALMEAIAASVQRARELRGAGG